MKEDERRQRRQGSHRTQTRVARRHRAEGRRTRRNLYIGFGGGAIALVLIVGLFLPSVDMFSSASQTPEQESTPIATINPVTPQPVGVAFPSLGQAHVPDGTVVEYNSMPPTSGPHYEAPANWGVYESQQPEGALVHNLEHGGINVNYNLSGADQIAELESFVTNQVTFPGCFVMQPHAGVAKGKVALTGWLWLEQFDGIDRGGMQDFINAHINRGPENFGPDCGAALQMSQ